MADNSFSWLHLTDLHFGLDGQDCLWPNLRQPFLDGRGKLHECCGPWDAVLFTGDLVQSGNPKQFQAMQQDFLDPLWERLHELGSGEAKLLAVPGNHDLLRPDRKADNPAADMLLSEDGLARVGDRFWAEPACSYRGVIKDAFAAYLDWWCSVSHPRTISPAAPYPGTLPSPYLSLSTASASSASTRPFSSSAPAIIASLWSGTPNSFLLSFQQVSTVGSRTTTSACC